MAEIKLQDLLKISDSLYEIPKSYRSDMRVPAQIFINNEMLTDVLHDRSLVQAINVATLPGIVKASMAMPDIHQGYGFPIGGVAGFDISKQGIISPGGIGYDINCGVRLLSVTLTAHELKPYLPDLATALYNSVPSGVGHGGKIILSNPELDDILTYGARKMLELGYGVQTDLEFCEENGSMPFADAQLVSDHAKNRGRDQLGTLGSGNHFLEVQEISEIYDEQAARIFGLEKNMVTVMIHCGSRGLGHQTCTDYVKIMLDKVNYYNITLPDKELACVPFNTPDGQNYFKAMCASANFAWANRHMITHRVREVFQKAISNNLRVKTVYDLSHNIGKIETHTINGREKSLIMHRKGATRAFGPHRAEVPELYKSVGHPVLIPGTMGTASYVMAGLDKNPAFGSCCHGAGRKMSRVQAKKSVSALSLRQELEKMGIVIRCDSHSGLSEEAPIAYKNVDNVVHVVAQAGLAKKVAQLKPLAVIKGG